MSQLDRPRREPPGSLPSEFERAVAPAAPDLAAEDPGQVAERDRIFASLFGQAPPRRTLGRYVVLGLLGRGGMGTVLRAYDERLDRRLAIKVLHAEPSAQQRGRLLREAQALAKLSHPNVVQIYEIGAMGEQIFIAMELVPGQSLDRWQRQRRSWRQLVKVYHQAGQGLAAAHAAGLVHRDFKPSNCIVDEQGRPRVLDFGLAKDRALGDVESTVPHLDPRSTDDARVDSLTKTGTIMGTLAYMPLEQLRGQEADERSDQFSFCVSMYEGLYGERPFDGNTVPALILQQRDGMRAAPPKGVRIPPSLRRLVLRGLSARPEDRWPSMEALLLQLARVTRPRRVGWALLGLSGGLAAVGLGLWQRARPDPICEGASDQLAGIWDDERRRTLRTAILGTELSYASDTWERMERRLDAYASGWIAQRTEICEATSIRREQSSEVMDLRMACSSRGRMAMEGAIGVLAEPDATRAERAVELLAALPSLSRCDDVTALQAAVPPPEDPEVTAEVEDLRQQLEQASALRRAGAYDAAKAIIDAAFPRVQTQGYPPLVAEALLERGMNREAHGDYPAASQDLHRAYILATEQGHDAVARDAVGHLGFLVGFRQARLEEATAWIDTALALARRPSAPPGAEQSALGSRAALQTQRGELEAAQASLERVLLLEQQRPEPEPLQIAETLANLGSVMRRRGRLDDAHTHLQRALDIEEQTVGPGHPSVAIAVSGLGAVTWQRGDLDGALSLFERSLAISEDVYGPNNPRLLPSLINIGMVQMTRSRLDEAMILLRRALLIGQTQLDPYNPRLAEVHSNLGLLLRRQGRTDEALTHLRRAQSIWEHSLGSEHTSVGIALSNIGLIFEDRGDLGEALHSHLRALEIRDRALGPAHDDVAMSAYNVGNVLLRGGDPSEARPYLQRALDIRREALGPDHPDLAYPLLGLSKVALDEGDGATARLHAERGLALRESGQTDAFRRAEARFVLARALWLEVAERPRARRLAEQAREALRTASAHRALRGRVEAWLAEHHER